MTVQSKLFRMHVHVTFRNGNFLEMNYMYLCKIHVAPTSALFCMLRFVVSDVISEFWFSWNPLRDMLPKVFQSIELTFLIESN